MLLRSGMSKNGKKGDNGKQSARSRIPETPASDQPVTMKAISDLIHKEFSTTIVDLIRSEITVQLQKIADSVNKLQTSITEHQSAISNLQKSVQQNESKLGEMEETVSTMKRKLDFLAFKNSDLESRMRRQNLRMIGVKEAVEADNPLKYFSQLLQDAFPTVFPDQPPLLDRVHRIPSYSPKSDKPRQVILRFHYFQDKEKLFRFARSKGYIDFKDLTFRLVEDFSKPIWDQRVRFRSVMSKLYNMDLKPALLYPSRLRIRTSDGTRRFFDSPLDAQKYLDQLSSSTS